MIDATSFNPHKEEDEGYLAAAAGQRLSENLYPCGTIRHEHWRRGWRIKTDELQRPVKLGAGDGQDDEGYLGAAAGLSILDNPYPYGTIRHEDWRRGWQAKSDEVRRSVRMGKEQG